MARPAAGSPLLAPLSAGSKGIYGMTKRKAAVRVPSSTPPGAGWRYGLALPFQVAPGLAGIACNIRIGFHDFEGGNDVFIFSDLSNIRSSRAVVLNRNEGQRHPRTGRP